MARVGSIAAIAWLAGGCLSSPPGDSVAIDASPPDAAPPDSGLETVENMTVLGDCTILSSENTLEAGVTYRLAVDGVVSLGSGAVADAEYYWFLAAPENIADGANGIDFGLAVDDLVFDAEGTPDWGDYRSDHLYEVEFIGLGERINAQFQDSDCENNIGELNLVIFRPPS